MKKLFFIFQLIALVSLNAAGQQGQIDSIEHHLSQFSDEQLGAELVKTCRSFEKGNPEILKHFCLKAIHHNRDARDTVKWGQALLSLGICYADLDLQDSAIATALEAQNLFKLASAQPRICDSHITLAIAYDRKRNYVNAIEQNLMAIECYETLADKTRHIDLLRAKSNLGIQYSKIDDLQKAEDYWNQVYSDPVTKTSPSFYSSISLNLCIMHRRQKNYDKAIEYGLSARDASDQPRTRSRVYNSLAAAYSLKKDYASAESYFLKCLNLQQELKDSIGIQRTYHNMGYMMKNKGDLRSAEKYFLSSNEEIKKRGDLSTLQQSYRGLSELAVLQKKYKSALRYNMLSVQVKDSIIGLAKKKAIADLEVKYETEKAKREKDLAETKASVAQLESKQNRNLFIGALLIASLILASSLFYLSRMRAKKKAELTLVKLKETEKRLALEKLNRDSELKALKAQMNPHFIFNALNSIQDYIVSNQKYVASDYLGKFAELIRNYLHFSDTGHISVTEEVKNLGLYLELEKLRFEEKLSYEISDSGFDDGDETYIPTMLIQPYIENALKHGLLHKPDNRELHISVSKSSDNVVQCIVEDNGIGRKKSHEINARRASVHKSFALKATSERLELLNHGKDQKIQVEIIDLIENGAALGTRVMLHIPIIKS